MRTPSLCSFCEIPPDSYAFADLRVPPTVILCLSCAYLCADLLLSAKNGSSVTTASDTRSQSTNTSADTHQCSFCAKPRAKVGYLVRAPQQNAIICDACIHYCINHLTSTETPRAGNTLWPRIFRKKRPTLITLSPNSTSLAVARQAAIETKDFPDKWERARQAYDHGNYEEALEAHLRLLDTKPVLATPQTASYVLEVLGLLWAELERYDEANRFFSSNYAHFAEHPGLYYAKGLISWSSGDLPNANEQFSQAIALSPQNSRYQSVRGQVLAELGSYPAALTDLDYSIQSPETEEQLAYSHNGKAFVLGMTGQLLKAMAEFELSLTLWPNNPWVFFNRARVYDQHNDSTSAMYDYRTALSQTAKPSLDTRQRNIAKARLRELGDF